MMRIDRVRGCGTSVLGVDRDKAKVDLVARLEIPRLRRDSPHGGYMVPELASVISWRPCTRSFGCLGS